VQSGASVLVSVELVGAEVEGVLDLALRHVRAAAQDGEGAREGEREGGREGGGGIGE